MSVTVDDLPLETSKLGLTTVGEVLSHVARENRLVVQLLIDGTEPDMGEMEAVRAQRLEGCALFIETARPAAICAEVLTAVDEGLAQAETLRIEAAELFRSGDASAGLQKLGLCFALWNNAQDSVGKVAQLIRADLSLVKTASGASVEQVAEGFVGQLKQLRDALEMRDFVLCCDVLTYDMESAVAQWLEATAAMRKVVGG